MSILDLISKYILNVSRKRKNELFTYIFERFL